MFKKLRPYERAHLFSVIVASRSEAPRRKGVRRSKEKLCVVLLLSPETVNCAEQQHAQVDVNSRAPHVKYAIVWQVVKVRLAHAHWAHQAQRALLIHCFICTS